MSGGMAAQRRPILGALLLILAAHALLGLHSMARAVHQDDGELAHSTPPAATFATAAMASVISTSVLNGPGANRTVPSGSVPSVWCARGAQ